MPVGLRGVPVDRNKFRYPSFLLVLLHLEEFRFLFDGDSGGRGRGGRLVGSRHLAHLLYNGDPVAGEAAKGDPGQLGMLEEGVEQLVSGQGREVGRGYTVAGG